MAIKRGFVFILEGDTEKIFYLSLVTYLCQKHNVTFEKIAPTVSVGVTYNIRNGNNCWPVKFSVSNVLSTPEKILRWFKNECLDAYDSSTEWVVFICYDTESYKKKKCKFMAEDYEELKLGLGGVGIVDLSACAEIEDVMLRDIDGILRYLEYDGLFEIEVHGRNGKAKMQNLYKLVGNEQHPVYKEGRKAQGMIDSLDMQKIIDCGNIPDLHNVENKIFEKNEI